MNGIRVIPATTGTKCKTCGKRFNRWTDKENDWWIGETEIEHISCHAGRIADRLMKIVNEHFENNKLT